MWNKAITVLLVLWFLTFGSPLPSDPAILSGGMDQTSAPPLPEICLGVSPDEFLELLSGSGFRAEMPDYSEFESIDGIENAPKDGRVYNMTDLSFYYKIEGYDLYFTFSSGERLTCVSCMDSRIPAPEGLRIGDSTEALEQLYGSAFAENPEDYAVLQYQLPGGFLNIFYDEDTVTHWTLSEYSNINND